jgi:biotin carboxylase
MGLLVIAADKNARAPGLHLADFAETVDTSDVHEILRVAEAYRVDAVISEQTDVAVPTAAYVAENMGLPGIGYEVSLGVTDKWLMREKCRHAGIDGPKYLRVQTAEEAVAAGQEIGFPVVLKPADGQASRGVTRIREAQEVPRRFANTKRHSRDGSVLVEEMMTGPESSVEAFVVDGHVEVFGICDKTKCAPPHAFDTRLLYPANFPTGVVSQIKSLNERVVRAVGITMGITHAEYIVTEGGVRLIEIAARGCGAGVATKLIPAMTGVDLIRARILQALGENPVSALTRSSRQLDGLLEFLLLPPGRIRTITGVDEAKNFAGVIDANYLVRPGDEIGEISNGGLRPGYLLAVGASRTEVLRTAEKVKTVLRVEMEN